MSELLLTAGNPTPQHRLCSGVGSGLFCKSLSGSHLSSETVPRCCQTQTRASLSLTNVSKNISLNYLLSLLSFTLHISAEILFSILKRKQNSKSHPAEDEGVIKKNALDVIVLFVFVFCYPVRRVIAAVAID